MGYTTDFYGEFRISPTLKPEHNLYLMQFSRTRRMRRDAKIAENMPDPVRISAGLPIGDNGAYFVGGRGFCGQDRDESVVMDKPCGQPGYWCQWIPNEEGNGLEWDGSEKFYEYVEWLNYLIEHFLKPWGYTLDGEVSWNGEGNDDTGVIYARDNCIEAVEDTNPGPSWRQKHAV